MIPVWTGMQHRGSSLQRYKDMVSEFCLYMCTWDCEDCEFDCVNFACLSCERKKFQQLNDKLNAANLIDTCCVLEHI